MAEIYVGKYSIHGAYGATEMVDLPFIHLDLRFRWRRTEKVSSRFSQMVVKNGDESHGRK